ncbi:hypothetical protein LIER_35651 [Lithospermum erythrorhizon]|uniref:Uncharacterized protein n=1 Tax=Lithospermum erythrorhizon TaxID=34254 RepID=A0AAV3NU50_LITER
MRMTINTCKIPREIEFNGNLEKKKVLVEEDSFKVDICEEKPTQRPPLCPEASKPKENGKYNFGSRKEAVSIEQIVSLRKQMSGVSLLATGIAESFRGGGMLILVFTMLTGLIQTIISNPELARIIWITRRLYRTNLFQDSKPRKLLDLDHAIA